MSCHKFCFEASHESGIAYIDHIWSCFIIACDTNRFIIQMPEVLGDGGEGRGGEDLDLALCDISSVCCQLSGQVQSGHCTAVP